MRRATIFVLSDVRSGSTLLDQCLGGHPSITSLGEVHWLTAYVAQDRSLYNPLQPLSCTCGMTVRECPFWNGVERALGRPLDSLQLRHALKRPRHARGLLGALRLVPRRLIKARPGLYRHRAIRSLLGGPRLGRDCVALYDAVSAATDRPFCVDSSKSAYRFRDVYHLDSARTIAIALARDYRAVVHSKMKRGQSLQTAAVGWRRRMHQIQLLTSDLPQDRIFRLKYESFCENPSSELARLCKFIGIDFTEAMLQRATGSMHHIGGSPSKFDSRRVKISLDRAYEGQFAPDALKSMRELVGNVAEHWGY